MPVIEEAKAKTIDGIVYLKAKVTDELSGVSHYAITINNRRPTAWSEMNDANGDILYEVSGSGTYYLWVIDEAGNEPEAVLVRAVKDIKPPVGSIDIQELNMSASGDKYTNKRVVTIKINVTDNESTMAEIKYALYNEEDYAKIKAGTKEIEWKNYTPSVTWTLKEPDGLNTIYAIFKDAAGNVTKY